MRISDPLRVRARSDQDVHEVVRWVPDAAALYFFSGPRLTWPLTAQQLQGLTGATAGMTPSVVVSSAGELVGHFDLTLDESIARLGRLIVNPSLRGRGLAIPVVDLALIEAQRLGADVVRLNVISKNETAVRTYRRAGFVVVAGDADRADVTTMERRLSDPKL